MTIPGTEAAGLPIGTNRHSRLSPPPYFLLPQALRNFLALWKLPRAEKVTVSAKEWERHRALDSWLALGFSLLATPQTQTEHLQLQSTLSCVWATVCQEASDSPSGQLGTGTCLKLPHRDGLLVTDTTAHRIQDTADHQMGFEEGQEQGQATTGLMSGGYLHTVPWPSLPPDPG